MRFAKLHNKEPDNLLFCSNIVRKMKQRRTRWTKQKYTRESRLILRGFWKVNLKERDK
jgi:hypothetical protein